ncbi:cyclin-dependent kinase inhibitor 1 isoform X2 [Notolabrus celidotus]|nr:cyclin-dependent kinase inhibitor 1 isoform X2 [Notolabrus celidotus]XP_034542467.1 cyclin-dependent kinase inhibitor 1 isoform X2 [Notolabrus celidotus]
MASKNWTLSSLGNGPARRMLFGPVDHEQLQAEYHAALRKDLEEASRRWGFDFMSDKPLESSDFKWERVQGTKVPLLYRSCMLDQGQAGGQRAAVTPKEGKGGSSQIGKENIPLTPERCSAFNLKKLEKRPMRRENRALKRKQSNITDFYPAKRRAVGMPLKSNQ